MVGQSFTLHVTAAEFSQRLLDIFHTVLVGVSIWFYLISSFGDINVHNMIFWYVAVAAATLHRQVWT